MGCKKRVQKKAEQYKKGQIITVLTLRGPTPQPIMKKKSMTSCGFCGSMNKGENINTCPKRN